MIEELATKWLWNASRIALLPCLRAGEGSDVPRAGEISGKWSVNTSYQALETGHLRLLVQIFSFQQRGSSERSRLVRPESWLPNAIFSRLCRQVGHAIIY